MQYNPLRLTTALSVIFACVLTSPASAQATRTWVSGVGDDVNPCSRTAPCKTFAGAISKTAAGGEISVLDPGGFGTVTITKSISIVNDDSGEAGILASSTNGINVNGAGVIVYLRGLVIDGGTPASPGLNGIRFLNGAALHVDQCIIKNFTAANAFGISFIPSAAAQLFVTNTTIANNGSVGAGGGILLQATGTGTVNAVINSTQINNNTVGVRLDGTGSTGSISLALRDSVTAGGSAHGVVVSSPVGGSALKALIDTSSLSGNGSIGLNVDAASASGLGSAVVRIGNSTVTNNNIGVQATNNAVIRSFKNNQIAGNNTDGTPITAFAGPGGTPLQ